MRLHQCIGLVAATAAAALALVACSGGPPPAPPTSGGSPGPPAAAAGADHNGDDVAFLQMMIPHHRQAVTMSTLASTRAASLQVKDLAGRIARAQGPEIEQMNRLLTSWSQPVPPQGDKGEMPMGGMPMAGMMSSEQMAQLAAASGPGFDRMFLTMMIEHHRGAVQMAQDEQQRGHNPEVKTLAGQILAAQQAEITEMQALLGK